MELGSFAELGLLFAIATVIALIMRFFRQPLIIGHIVTGILVGHYGMDLFKNIETFELFSHLGISFLLFSVGLNLNPKILKQYGFASVLVTIGQVLLTGSVGILLCLLMGYDQTTALYVGVSISFSSTVIVLKILADKGDLDKLYVKISIGSLLLQDLLAIILLFALPIVSGASGGGLKLLQSVVLGLFAGVGVFLVANKVVSRMHSYLSKSQELLFLFANAWGICIAVLFHNLGFSLEGGALIAGVALANLPSSHEISARLTPLRDFFIVAFFVLLGTRMAIGDLGSILIPAVVISLFVLFINPLIQLVIMGFLGYRKKTSFQTGMMAAQISEFSLILVGLGVTLGQVEQDVLSTITLVGIITIFISTYLIMYSDKIYLVLAPALTIFERKRIKERPVRSEKYPIVLLGNGRISYDFIELFQKQGSRFLVIEHDPDILNRLAREHIAHEYGDASDPDFLEEIKIQKSELVVSTIPDLETNHLIISVAKRVDEKPVVIVVSNKIDEALELYESGADYVILPHYLGSKYATSIVKKHIEGVKHINTVREKHVHQLESRKT